MIVLASERRMERATSGVGFACVDGCLSESAMSVKESRSGRFEAESVKHDIGTEPLCQSAVPSDETVRGFGMALEDMAADVRVKSFCSGSEKEEKLKVFSVMIL
jgi:hypothetical protein